MTLASIVLVSTLAATVATLAVMTALTVIAGKIILVVMKP